MEILAHTMEYQGENIEETVQLRNYYVQDYEEYKKIYEECFHEMRTALGRVPVDICRTEEELELNKNNIYILELDGKLLGAVTVYGNEIDDLIVRKSHQRLGYGETLLKFAVSRLQKHNICPIVLHVADWNQGAIKLYLKNGFSIIKTETV